MNFKDQVLGFKYDFAKNLGFGKSEFPEKM